LVSSNACAFSSAISTDSSKWIAGKKREIQLLLDRTSQVDEDRKGLKEG